MRLSRQPLPARQLLFGCAMLLSLLSGNIQKINAQETAMKLSEGFPNPATFSNQSTITTTGTVQAVKSDGSKDTLDLTAEVGFDYLSRRLPPSGRDAEALREIRYFNQAELKTKVLSFETVAALPDNRRVIVVNGSREGMESYAKDGTLTRETLDLLEIPGDSLALVATLPPTDVRVGDEWSPSDWVIQMLTGIEALESSEMRCKLEQATSTAAKITFTGKIKGQKLGTNTEVSLLGVMIFNREANFIAQAKTVYSVTSEVGTVNPGMDLRVTTNLVRKQVPTDTKLPDQLVETIPLTPAPRETELLFQAKPWRLELAHGRNWHLFNAIYDGGAPVAILRLIDQGSFVAQCNFSPAATSASGQMTPIELFESDIEKSLGDRFGAILSQENIPLDDGRKIYRITVSGHVQIASTEGRKEIEMNWIYYLVNNPSGRQASFVFSVEPTLLPQLGDQDRQLVQSLRFE